MISRNGPGPGNDHDPPVSVLREGRKLHGGRVVRVGYSWTFISTSVLMCVSGTRGSGLGYLPLGVVVKLISKNG